MFSVPWPAARISLTSQEATASASNAITATMTTRVRLPPLTPATPLLAARVSLNMYPPREDGVDASPVRDITPSCRVPHGHAQSPRYRIVHDRSSPAGR